MPDRAGLAVRLGNRALLPAARICIPRCTCVRLAAASMRLNVPALASTSGLSANTTEN